MPILEWTEKYSINIIEMDAQHKRLVGFINDVWDAKQEDKDHKILKNVLDELLDYTGTHFKREEELMKQHGYPGYEEHKKEHSSLFEGVLYMRKIYDSGHKDTYDKIVLYLGNWLMTHEISLDKKYAVHLNSKGVT